MSEVPTNCSAAEEATPGSEYEREPVPERSLLGFKSFVGDVRGANTQRARS